MNTTPGARLIEPVTGCRWRRAGCKGSFAARKTRRLPVGQRALAFGRLRGRSGRYREKYK